ncbi:MAG: CHAT domain-containing protein [Spirochaetota bacterium]
MAYLIYTDRANMLKSIQSGKVRIPAPFLRYFDLHRIKKGDKIFLFNIENGKIYGPATAEGDQVIKEKNPKKGPFNGPGNVNRHYLYFTAGIDCTRVYKKGALVDGYAELDPGKLRFFLTTQEEKNLLNRLFVANTHRNSIIINLSLLPGSLSATVVEVKRSTSISSFEFTINRNFLSSINRKISMGEKYLRAGRKADFLNTLKEAGKAVYNGVFEPLKLEGVFRSGDYWIYIRGGTEIASIPLELAYKHSFIFEKNVFTYRGEEGRVGESVKVNRVLIVADPPGRCAQAYQEGKKLYDFLKKTGLQVVFISRPISADLLSEFFSSCNIIHFCGHAGAHKGEQGWDTGCGVFGLGDMVGRESLPEMVFSSSCGTIPNLGFELLKLGCSNVVSTRWSLPDMDISDFVISFYRSLLDNLEVGFAFTAALRESYAQSRITPLCFSLYGESKLVYFK